MPFGGTFQTSRGDVPKPNTIIICTPTLDRFVVKSESENWHQKDMFNRDWTECSKVC